MAPLLKSPLLAFLAKEVTAGWQRDQILRQSAALAYYAVISLAPLLVLILGLAAGLLGEDVASGQLKEQLTRLMGERASASVLELLATARYATQGPAAVVGALMLLFGATNLFAELKQTLNAIWGGADQPPRGGIIGWLRTRLLALGMVVAILALLLASLLITGALAYASNFLHADEWLPAQAWQWAGHVWWLAGEVVFFALVFKYLPDRRIAWRPVWLGAAATAVAFEAGRRALAWYLSVSFSAGGQGAAGSFLLLLVWIYYSFILILTGAEFTRAQSKWSRAAPAA